LGLPANENVFSYSQIKTSFGVLATILQKADEKRAKEQHLSSLEQQADTLYQRLITIDRLGSGELITVIPAANGAAWTSPYKTSGEQSEAFKKLAADHASRSAALTHDLAQWLDQVQPMMAPGQWSRITMEVLYYDLQPFHYAGILYFLGFVLLLVVHPLVRNIGALLLCGGFAYHSVGLLLRALILMRPPVANMYETMIFMDWVLMLCLGVVVIVGKRRSFLSSGAIASALVMLFAGLLPVDQSLDVLAPVLRSSYWLTVHVITIISSYSFFALAMAVSHRHLFLAARGKMTPQEDQVSAQTIDRLLQVGQIALGAGTILGGVWANEAWGRFWGWDPKETWAFITFLGYMVILHLRYSKRLSNFALAVGGILGFLLVVMTWYGVNFVLGRGMHSYGAGSGGLLWIGLYLAMEAVFLAYVGYKRSARKG
jgi:cytochrome c-type biogenesis protein CcsB